MRVGRASLDNIERIPAPEPGELDRRFLRPARPVVLTGLLDGEPTRRLADPAFARWALADVPMVVAFGADDGSVADGVAPQRTVGFRSFYDHLSDGLGDEDFCVEHATPPGLAAFVPPPRYVDELGEPGDGWVSQAFMAAAGYRVHLHYDDDLRHVLMAQLLGRKRYVVVDPSETRKLAPASPPGVRCSSGLFLEHFSDHDLDAFVRYANAWDTVLEPGEVLLIPAGSWHYVEYLDVSLSVNFRFGRNAYTRFLAEAFPLPGVELQALVAACFRDVDEVGPAEADAFAVLEAAAARRYRDERARADAADLLGIELCRWLGLPVAGDPYHAADIARRARLMSQARRPSLRRALRRRVHAAVRS